MNAVALLGALLIGLTLGLLGSGGSILTVPVLVYLVGQPEKVAIAGSLVIVGAIAAIGVLPRLKRGLVDGRSVLLFGGPGMVGAFLGARLSHQVSGAFQLALFAAVMLAASWSMWRRQPVTVVSPQRVAWKVMADGLAVGALTGFVGVGGGFLIVPALVVLGGIALPRAVATSLAIIALNSGIGAWQHLDVLAAGPGVDWAVIGAFIVLGTAGSLVGHRLSDRIPQAALKRGFAVFLVVMALYILWRSLPGLF